MIEQLLSGRKRTEDSSLLWIDPSNLATGATAIVDRSPVGVSITNTGVVVANVGPFTGDKSLYFSAGSLCYLRLAQDKCPAILLGDFTIEYWFRPETRTGTRAVVTQWRQTTGSGGIICNSLADGTDQLWLGSYNENAALLSMAGTTQLLEWEHIRYVRSGNTFRSYRNGTLVSTASSTTTRARLTIDWVIGSYFSGTGTLPPSGINRLNGWVTKIKVYNRVLTNSNFTPT